MKLLIKHIMTVITYQTHTLERRLGFILGAFFALWASAANGGTYAFDTLIVNARIVDGGGNPWVRGSIGIRGSRIVAVGSLVTGDAKRVIDAEDRIVAPGFIDLMGQSTFAYVQDPVSAEGRLRQGITTQLSGEGWSHAPESDRTQNPAPVVDGRKVKWRSYEDYFRLLTRVGLPLNVVHNVGAAQVRQVVMGDSDRAPTDSEMAAMKKLVAKAMRDGAVGISSALIYPPGAYATTSELTELTKVVSCYGGTYFSHIRNESDQLLNAIDEALQIGRVARVPVHIYHLKAAGFRNWPLMELAIKKINLARSSGLDVTADVYPYTRNGIAIESFLPPSFFAQGGDVARRKLDDPRTRDSLRRLLEGSGSQWENWYEHVNFDWNNVLIVESGSYPRELSGLSVQQAAVKEQMSAWDLFFDLALARAEVAPESMDEGQKRAVLEAPWVMVDTDQPPVNPGKVKSVHPRAFGSFPRVLAKYVREDQVLTLEEAIRRMTSLAAGRLGLFDRGRIAPGMAADIVMFDPNRIQDRATFERPLQYASGVDYLFVNGQLVIDAGRITAVRAGEVLRHKAPDLDMPEACFEASGKSADKPH